MNDRVETGRYAFWDFIVWVLAFVLVAFLLITMGIRTEEARIENECQRRLLALAQAQQLYLVQNERFADELERLRRYLEVGDERMPFVCPITGNHFEIRVQGDAYKIVAPGTEYHILTGDPSW